VLRNRNFLLSVVARFIASFGSQMLEVAVGYEIYERTGSKLLLGYVGLTQFLPMLAMTLPAGHLADTHERRKIIMGMQSVLMLSSLGLFFVSRSHAAVHWTFLCLLASGAARTFLWSASASFLPQLVTREEFPRALTWFTGAFQFSAITGPVVGGAIYDWTHGAATVYLANAVMAALCVALFAFVRVHHKPIVKEEVSMESLLGGFRFVFQNRTILAVITLDLFAVLFGGATSLLPVYAKDILRVGSSGMGLLRAALPAGSLACAALLAWRPPMKKAGRSLLLAVVVFGLATIGFGLSKWFWLSLLMLFISGFADNVSVIVRHTLVQLLTPDSMRGRVSSVNNLFIGTSNELGGFESGFVAQYCGSAFSVVSGGAMSVLVALGVAFIWPEIPRFGRLVQSESKEWEKKPPIAPT
jgi:MFS family permease